MSNTFKFVKPANASDLVFNPVTKMPIKAEGEEVAWSTYWQRRLNAKEIEVSEVATQTETKTKTKNK